jgi:hypothetical protein
MTTHERVLRRARQCFVASMVLFILFCLLGGGGWTSLASPWISKPLEVLGFLSGVFSWSLMCTAYDRRRRAL